VVALQGGSGAQQEAHASMCGGARNLAALHAASEQTALLRGM